MNLVYIPVYLYYFLLAFKARAGGFFSAANPGITFGGLLGESKIDILNMLPKNVIPVSIFIPKGISFEGVLHKLKRAELNFPIIAKPNVGERGFLVEKISDAEELKKYLDQHHLDIILQEFIAYPEEVGVLYYRLPGKQKGHITSLTLKKFLTVTGDGYATIASLIRSSPRSRLQYDALIKKHPEWKTHILPAGQTKQLVTVGNHCRGTMFINGNEFIDEQLVSVFDKLCKEIKGIYFGRFDIRCNSLEDLKGGKNFCILEFNGVKSEPTHIYEPGYSLWKAYRELFQQWRIIYEISIANHERGIPFASFWDAVKALIEHKRYKKTQIEDALPVMASTPTSR